MPTDNPTLKRLEEIEASAFVVEGEGDCVGVDRASFGRLTARLRDALVVIESQQETISQAMWFFKLRSKYPKWVEAYRRLFGEEQDGG